MSIIRFTMLFMLFVFSSTTHADEGDVPPPGYWPMYHADYEPQGLNPLVRATYLDKEREGMSINGVTYDPNISGVYTNVFAKGTKLSICNLHFNRHCEQAIVVNGHTVASDGSNLANMVLSESLAEKLGVNGVAYFYITATVVK